MIVRIFNKLLHMTELAWAQYAPLPLVRLLQKKYRGPEKVVVSIATFPDRFPYIDLCIRSLLLQRVRPDVILVNLGEDSLGTNWQEVFSRYEKYGLQVHLDEEQNYRSHKKYCYAFQDYREDLIITVDDDLVYSPFLISSLLKAHKKYPHAVVGRRVHNIKWNEDGTPKPYLEWEGECRRIKEPAGSLMVTTGAGALFCPGQLAEETVHPDLFYSLAPTADDIWLKVLSVYSGVKTVYAPNVCQMPASIKVAQKQGALSVSNVESGNNDVIFARCLEHFRLTEEDFA